MTKKYFLFIVYSRIAFYKPNEEGPGLLDREIEKYQTEGKNRTNAVITGHIKQKIHRHVDYRSNSTHKSL